MPSGVYKRKIRSQKYPLEKRQECYQFFKQGKTYSEISKILGIPNSTVHYWIRTISVPFMNNRSCSCGKKMSGYSRECKKCFLSHGARAWLGKKRPAMSESWKKNIGDGHRGVKNYRWIVDRTQIKRQEDRNNPEYKQWRVKVWGRDNFTCCIKNSDCKGKIEAHHILSWSEYPELRYEVNNGITVCHFHHPRKKMEEKSMIPTFNELVLAITNK